MTMQKQESRGLTVGPDHLGKHTYVSVLNRAALVCMEFSALYTPFASGFSTNVALMHVVIVVEFRMPAC